MELPKVGLADDQKEVLRTIARILQEHFHVVGTAENGQRAIELAEECDADVIVLDICMPAFGGIEAASHLKGTGSHARILFLTVHEDRDFLEAAFSAGAIGYVLKSFMATDLVPAIVAALNGDSFVSPRMQMPQVSSSGH